MDTAMATRALISLLGLLGGSTILIANAAFYEVSIDRFEPYKDTDRGFMDYGTLRVSKKGRNLFVIDGKFEMFQNMDDETKSVFEIYYGENRKPTYSGSVGLCEAANMDNKIMEKLRQVSNIPDAGTCPYPKGKYHIDKYELDESQLPMAIPAGKYLLDVKFMQSNQVKAGYKLRVTIK